jgi:putative ABC transport system permease protein
MGDLLADVRHAARALARSPWFAGLAVATLAIGIGGTTALFSMVNAVLLRSLPFADPDRMVEIWGEDANRSGMRVPGAIVEALRARATALAAIAVHSPFGGILATGEGPVDLRGERVSANFTDVNGVQPVLGRGFRPAEEAPGASPVMLVSFGFWQRYLDSDPAAVGRTVYFQSTPYVVVGVMPADFRTRFGVPLEFWTPYAADNVRELERTSGYELTARLSPGVTVDEAREQARAIAERVTADGWGGADGRRIGIVPIIGEIVGNRADGLRLLLAAAAIVLAVACVNVAQLLLSRSDARAREFATRKAIGAGTASLFRLALIESLFVAAAGGLAGVALASWMLPALVAMAPPGIPRLAEASIDGRVLAFALALSLTTGVVFGTAPAWTLARRSPLDLLRRSHGGRVRGAGGSTLVVVQVAASVALLVLAALVGRTFLALLPGEPGFEPRSRLAFPLPLVPFGLYPAIEEKVARLDELTRRLEAVPGIGATAIASNFPFSSDDVETAVRDAGAPPGSPPALTAQARTVSAAFFDLMRMPLLRGRSFSSHDRVSAPRVAVVNQRMAERLSPAGEVIGRRIVIGRSGTAAPLEVVGVIANARTTGTTAEPVNEVYVPLAHGSVDIVYVIAESSLDAAAFTALIRREIRQALPGVALRREQAAVSMADRMQRALAAPRLTATLFTAMSAVAMGLAAIGLFGMVAYSVSRRIPELGLRAALGARPRDLVAATTRAALVATATGVAAGLAAGLYLTRFVRHQLYAVDPFDVPTFALAAILMLMVAAVAAYVPARRAATLDPMAALRHD